MGLAATLKRLAGRQAPRPSPEPVVGPVWNTVILEYRIGASLQRAVGHGVRGRSHPERLVWASLEAQGVRASQVLRIHSELEPCVIPGGHCREWIKATFPLAEINARFPYGADARSRARGVAALRLAAATSLGAAAAAGRVIAYPDAGRAGATDLVRIEAAALAGLGLPEAAVLELTEAGLPRHVESLFDADGVELVDAGARPGRWCRFGSDGGSSLCIETESGQVSALSPLGPAGDRFVNVSLSAFQECLARTSAARGTFGSLADEAIDACLVDLERDLRQLDPRAFADPENWWSVVFEQLREGLL